MSTPWNTSGSAREVVSEDLQGELEALPGRILDPLVGFQPWRFIDPESGLADRLIALMAERGTFITPTLTLSQSILSGNTAVGTNPAGLDEMPEAVANQWSQYAYPFDYSDSPVDRKPPRPYLGRRLR